MKDIRKIRIKKVTGFRYLSMFDQMDGKRDYKGNQVCDVDGGLTTPRIVQKCRSCDQYTNELYLNAVAELESIYTEIAVGVEELRYFDPETVPEINRNTDFGEESKRQNAAHVASRRAKIQRRRELFIRLAELRQKCRIIDEVLRHNIDRAHSVLRVHVENYWSGVLKKATGEQLPVSPIMTDENLSGKPAYIEHQQNIENLLMEVLEGGETA